MGMWVVVAHPRIISWVRMTVVFVMDMSMLMRNRLMAVLVPVLFPV